MSLVRGVILDFGPLIFQGFSCSSYFYLLSSLSVPHPISVFYLIWKVEIPRKVLNFLPGKFYMVESILWIGFIHYCCEVC